uniref:Uncharacterized protein n=1 Tax=Timema poppense TaxID=170557 RepID=A0A7R9HGL7_TIMPO|nr:unnamed protein product [Timema poppensis]
MKPFNVRPLTMTWQGHLMPDLCLDFNTPTLYGNRILIRFIYKKLNKSLNKNKAVKPFLYKGSKVVNFIIFFKKTHLNQ